MEDENSAAKRPRLEASQDGSQERPPESKCPFAAERGAAKKSNKVEEPGSLIDDELRQFQVLDEVQGDEDGTGSECDEEGSDGGDSSEFDLDENELENMLDEALPEDLKKRKQVPYEERFKTVVEEKGRNHFDVLPEGWLQVTHNSGIALYLHKSSRVCTVSRPYFLGPGSVRKHELPISAIPCLNYRRALEKEEEERQKLQNGLTEVSTANPSSTENSQEAITAGPGSDSRDKPNIDENSSQNDSQGNGTRPVGPLTNENSTPPNPLRALHNAKIETVTENLKAQSLTAAQVNEYCRKLFHFKTIRVMRFKSWSARRKFTVNRKKIKNLQRPTLPDGTKFITFPVPANDANGNPNNHRGRKEWIMNPNGKSYVCILHEYAQHAIKKQPTYEFKELENPATPYSASVTINGLQYGTGYGTSKKQAKSEAAREALEVLIPEMRDKITSVKSGNSSTNNYKHLSVFDEIRIEDPRVTEFCEKTTEPTPHAILLTCLQRNFGLGDVKINYQVNPLKHKKNEFTMTVGKHTATVVCKNKRDGKQLASQAILQILHPHIKSWGSLLRLYGNHSVKTTKEKKQEEQEITVLQSKAAINQPNYAILDKLKLEMTKLGDSRAAIKSIGTFIPPSDVELPTASSSNLNNVEL
ncbi:unnamed protein product [Hermetia illucens]|uniref:DRBM domain-containing protein n=1 Tax=Hermetia illucens TaxID=343691 RepID=A0A7R8V5B1_HERIL|nr:microprocessor complex subunit DGCR8 isoform X2 [Hermetia illucens]CAD7092377.1 unnamed protein product [Hermetia illucens]